MGQNRMDSTVSAAVVRTDGLQVKIGNKRIKPNYLTRMEYEKLPLNPIPMLRIAYKTRC